jgi:hypothetical protein
VRLGTVERVRVLQLAWRKPAVRRLCLATGAFRAAELGVWIALIAYVYTAGGVREASAVTVAQLVPATLFALTVGDLIRRFGGAQVLRIGLVVQAAGMMAGAVLLRQELNAAAFVAAIVAATAVTTTRPALSVLTPGVVDSPDELSAANVFSGLLVALAGLVGPATAAIVMTAVGSWAVFALMALVVATAAATVWRVPNLRSTAEDDALARIAALGAIARERAPRTMVMAVAVFYVVIGAFDVLSVVIAVELLNRSEAFSGYVTTAVGAGCVLAGSVSLLVIGRRRLAPWVLVSAAAVGATLVCVSAVGARVPLSLLILVGFGVAQSTYELTSLMLLQRVTRLDLLGHVFSVVEALQMAMLAIGAALVPLAVQLFGSPWAPAAIGILFVALVGMLATRIILIDRHARVPITEMARLRATPLFGALPGPALETIARESRRLEVAAGEVVVKQGEPGSEYFAVVSGELAVSVDGVERRALVRGDGFGEIALLHDVPRAATVRATASSVLLAVGREPFLAAVTGHAQTRDRATSIVATHLTSD